MVECVRARARIDKEFPYIYTTINFSTISL